MSKRLAAILMIVLAVGTAAQAQSGGGGGHGRGGHGRGAPSGGTSPAPAAPAAPTPRPTALNQIEIVGVVKAIDVKGARITIDYEAVEALNWPSGSMPFEVYQGALLDGVTVGEKVRFKIDGQQIWNLRPF